MLKMDFFEETLWDFWIQIRQSYKSIKKEEENQVPDISIN